MNRNILKKALILLMLYPCSAKADFDMISMPSHISSSIQSQIDRVFEEYMNLQANLQELNVNRNILSNLRNEVKNEFNKQMKTLKGFASVDGAFQMFFNTKLADFSLPGVVQYVNMGAYRNPGLTKELGKIYLKKTNEDNDVSVNYSKEETVNDLNVENVGVLFANSLMNRKRLQDEEDEIKKKEEEEASEGGLTDVPQIMHEYTITSERANHRWVNMLAFQSSYIKQKSESATQGKRFDDASDVTGEGRTENKSGGKYQAPAIPDIATPAYNGEKMIVKQGE